MTTAPSQSYKVSALGEGGGGTHGGSGFENFSQASSAAGNSAGARPADNAEGRVTVQQEMGASLGNDFRLAGTKAESKGEERTSAHPAGSAAAQAHDVDMPSRAPHAAPQLNDVSSAHNKPKFAGRPAEQGLRNVDTSGPPGGA